MKTITGPDMIALLERAVEEKGADYVAPGAAIEEGSASSCEYFDEVGKPSCIIGHVMHYLAPTYMSSSVKVARYELYEFSESTGTRFTSEALTAATRAQYKQDNGATWGAALNAAKGAAA